ncbi:hypothetical protein [Arenimonas fontis]|uniref:DNA gyrase subunit B n=1 Tax=Arenimonas fontis TaxID=2608255 RepID=A0A5B2ZCS8_9GAMM|nr:hypothetical protein [Arenimonas fontis]KAA2285946.1 hypothetical protein F0415_00095 [Arenimonas fontis]
MARAAAALAWLATLLYPLAIWLGLARFEPRNLALILLVVALLRVFASPQPAWLLAAGAAALLSLLAWLGNAGLPLKLYPVVVNTVMLALFGWSLRHPPTVIERIARLRHPDLPGQARPWLVKVTRAWCLFFVGNGAVALWTALAGSDAAWALYNGAIAYVLMGMMFLGEWWLRPKHAR